MGSIKFQITNRGELKTFSETQAIEEQKKKEQTLLKSKQAKKKLLEMKKKREVELKKPKTLLNAQGSHEKLYKNKKNRFKAMSMKRKKESKGLGIKVIKAEMNSVSKRADYLCRVSIFKTTKSTKVGLKNIN